MSRKKEYLLLGCGIAVTVVAALATYSSMQIRATAAELAKTLAEDGMMPRPNRTLTHAFTTHRNPNEVWPWLAQMGSSRAAWYAHDFMDKGGHPGAERIRSENRNISVTVFPVLSGGKTVFVAAQCEPERSLVLSSRLLNGRYQTTRAVSGKDSSDDLPAIIPFLDLLQPPSWGTGTNP